MNNSKAKLESVIKTEERIYGPCTSVRISEKDGYSHAIVDFGGKDIQYRTDDNPATLPEINKGDGWDNIRFNDRYQKTLKDSSFERYKPENVKEFQTQFYNARGKLTAIVKTFEDVFGPLTHTDFAVEDGQIFAIIDFGGKTFQLRVCNDLCQLPQNRENGSWNPINNQRFVKKYQDKLEKLMKRGKK